MLQRVNQRKKGKPALTERLRQQRRNEMSQRRRQKRDSILNEKRKLGLDKCPPILISILNNSGDSAEKFLDSIRDCDSDLIIDQTLNGKFCNDL